MVNLIQFFLSQVFGTFLTNFWQFLSLGSPIMRIRIHITVFSNFLHTKLASICSAKRRSSWGWMRPCPCTPWLMFSTNIPWSGRASGYGTRIVSGQCHKITGYFVLFFLTLGGCTSPLAGILQSVLGSRNYLIPAPTFVLFFRLHFDSGPIFYRLKP